MYLGIITADRANAFLMLFDAHGVQGVERVTALLHAHANVLRHLDRFLKRHAISARALKGIGVVSGPGQFSFLRTGIVIANTFGCALSLPVVSCRFVQDRTPHHYAQLFLKKLARIHTFQPVVPAYGKKPHITKKKKQV